MRQGRLKCPRCGAEYVPSCQCCDGPAPDFVGEKNPVIGTCSIPAPVLDVQSVEIVVRRWAGKQSLWWATITKSRLRSQFDPITNLCVDLPAKAKLAAVIKEARAFAKHNGWRVARTSVEK